MKTRQLTLIGTVLAVSALSLPFIINETAPKPEIPKTPNLELIDELVELGCTEPAINHIFRYSNLLDDSFDGTYYVDAIGYPDDLSQVEFDKCVSLILEIRTISNGVSELDPNPHPEPEPNTIIIYDVTDNSETRLSIDPHYIVMDLKYGDTVTFVNDGSTTVNIFDNSKGLWRFDNVKPSSQRTLVINSTGFYEFLVQNSILGESGEIVALSEDTNSLPVETRAKMAQTIVGSDFGKEVGLIFVGSGSAEPGITIGIDEKFQDKYDDAEKFYYEKYRKMIPFDVPITIEFSTPIVPTG